MYQQIDINKLMAQTGIKATAARLFILVCRYVNLSRMTNHKDKRGIPYCFASKGNLAKELGVSIATTKRAIRQLKDAGMIESQQTTANAHIFVTYYGQTNTDRPTNDTVGRGENDTLNYSTLSNNNTVASSINQSTIPTPGAEANAENSEQGRASYAAATTEAAEDEGQRRGRTAGQVESTGTTRSRNDQRQEAQTPAPAAGRIGTDGRHHGEDQRAQGVQLQGRDEAKWREVRETLRNNCDMEYEANHCSTPDEIEDYERKSAVIDMAADAASVKGGFVKVAGAALTISQWLNVIERDVNGTVLHDTIIRVLRAEAFGKVKNPRAYMLATLYNTAQQSRYNGERYALAF